MFVTLGGAAAAIAALPASALGAPSPPKITSAFTPATINVGGTSALSFTITNPNTGTTSLSGIAFTDTLPTGLIVDNPNGQNGSCGSTSTLTATAGGSTISLTGGKLAAGASCTVQAAVTSATPGPVQNSTGAVSSTEGGAGAADIETLTVIPLPSVSVTSPTEGQTFDFGQKVIARYSCQEGAGGPGLSACSGDVPSGTAIDTKTPGAQTFTVSGVSLDGGITTQTIDYTVRPDNHFKVSHLKAHGGGSVSFAIKLPGPGKLAVLEREGRHSLKTVKRKVTTAGTLDLTLPSSATVTRLLKKQPKAKVFVRIQVQFTPTGGVVRKATSAPVLVKA